MAETKKDLINQLQKDILLLQGFKPPTAATQTIGLGPVESAFPNGIFPVGAIHEIITTRPEDAAAGGGFVGGIIKSLMKQGGACLWISTSRSLFPPSLKAFGVEPDKIIFVDLKRERDVLWATEEALKCEGLAAVIAELNEMSFTQSRRLQLAVEQSKVTGFIMRTDARKLGTTACTARWKISHLPSELPDGLPGVGHPRWNVELLKVRNGNPGMWQMEWITGRFVPVMEAVAETMFEEQMLNAG